jgi:hypothetical protein
LLVVTFKQLTAPLSEQASVAESVKCSKVRYPETSTPSTDSTNADQAGADRVLGLVDVTARSPW